MLVTVACLCYREYNDIAAGYGFGAPGVVGYGAGLLLLVRRDVPWLALVGLTLVVLVLVMRAEDLAHALPRAALLLTGIVYVFGCWKCARPLRELSPHWLMYGLVLNWVGDIGAYYVGRPFGKAQAGAARQPEEILGRLHRFGRHLGVWWEPFTCSAFSPACRLWQAIALTVAANIAGQFGDLAESAMKRGAGVKDSGGILPGHGGFLDRVDSTLFALPVIYAYLKLV